MIVVNNDNLKNLKDRSIEERKEIALLGAKASAKKRKQNKNIREELLLLLDSEDNKGITNREKISIALIKKAKQGNVKAFELIQNITEGKPNYQLNLYQNIPIIIDDIK